MRVVVTGGNGFLGSHVAEKLGEQGHQLRLLLRPTSNVEFIDGLLYERADGDVLDIESLERTVVGADVVVHLAGLTFSLQESQFQTVNGQGTANLVQAAKQAGVKRFVYISSLAAQGPTAGGGPASAYGRSKQAGEWAALAERDSMDVVIVRAPVVYGPRDRALLTFFNLVKLGVMPLYADGRRQLSWVHAQDAASAIACTLGGEGVSGRVYTMADGEPHTWRELGGLLAEVLHKHPLMLSIPPRLFWLGGQLGGLASQVTRKALPLNPDKVREMGLGDWVCDSAAIQRDYGWQPAFDAATGIASTVRWYEEHGWV